jgi:hypothetical protein
MLGGICPTSHYELQVAARCRWRLRVGVSVLGCAELWNSFEPFGAADSSPRVPHSIP